MLLITIIMFINIACGIAIISSASPMMQEKLNYTATETAAIVGLIDVFNGLGRIIWSTLSDYLGRTNTYIIFFAFQVLAFIIFLLAKNLNGVDLFSRSLYRNNHVWWWFCNATYIF